MNKSKLKKEGEKWVKDGIISEQQLEEILNSYVKRDQSYLLVLFAVLLMGIGVLIFIFTDLAQVPNISRLTVMIVSMLALYIGGHYFHARDKTLKTSKLDKDTFIQKNSHYGIYGSSFIVLGYIFFGATIFLILNMYQVNFFNVWPFIIWSVIGLLLYSLYKDFLLFTVALIITIFSQIYSAFTFSSFNYIVFLILLFGYFHYVYHRVNPLFSYVFTIGLSLQILIFSIVEATQYYWFIFFILLMYVLGEFIPKKVIKQALLYISLLSIFIFKMYESFLLQEEYFLSDIRLEVWFFILLGVTWILVFLYKWRKKKAELMDLILFIPLFFLPYSYIFIILTMFLFAVYWLVVGFQNYSDEKIIIGIVSFLISTFTVYVQFAWETLNKSLFFLIGGVILFVISFVLERKRRTAEMGKGGHKG